MDFTAWFGAFMGAFGFLLGAMFMWLWDRTGNVPDSTAGAAYDASESVRYSIHDEVDMIVEALQ